MAQRWAEAVALQRLYLATCRAEDEEMTRRVARHQDMRGPGWQCLEEPLDPTAALDRIFAAVAHADAVEAAPGVISAGIPTDIVGNASGIGLPEMQTEMQFGLERGGQLAQEPVRQSVRQPGVILLDCISLWIANLLAQDQGEDIILQKVSALGQRLAAPALPVAVVSAETGLGLVPMSPLGRAFNDVLGLANQELARSCHHVVFVSCGLPLPLKGALPEELC